MALADFLTEGADIPQGSALKATTSQTILPDWYTKYATDLLASQQALAAQPMATFQGPRVAGFTPDQTAGADMTKSAAGAFQPALQAGTNALTQAAGLAGSATTGENANLGINSAAPYLAKAAGSAADVSAYMDPYIGSVVNRIGDLGTRNLTENLLPAIEGRYIGAGQFNGSGKMTDTARAIRDVSADVLAQQNSALSEGYKAAQGASLADLARYGSLGATAGQLGNAQQNTLLNAAGVLGNTGSSLANTGSLAQSLGLTGANAVTGVGDKQQQLNQTNLDVAYSDFLRQQGYPQEQINKMLSTFQGVSTGIPTATQETGIVPTGTSVDYKPSTASTIASTLTGLGGLLAGIKGL